MTRIATAFIVALLVVAGAVARQPDADDILARLQHSFDALEDYRVTVVAEIDMVRMRVPRMKATLYFKQPDKIHFESETFAMLPRDGVGFNPLVYTKNYTGQVAGIDTVDGVQTTKVFLRQKNESVRIRELTIWVDTRRWTVVKMESIPSQGRQIRMTMEYTKVEDTWWLPVKTLVTLDFSQPAGEEQQSRDNESHSPMGRSRLPRKGTVTVIYSDYRVNQHLPDAMFEKKNPEKAE